jgi:hypothetical protein
MNDRFTPEEISKAGRIVKQATARRHAAEPARPINVDAAIQSLMGPGSYDTWLGPKSVISPTPTPAPTFWESLRRSTLGALDIPGAYARGFVGLGPGPSGASNLAATAPHYLWSKLTGNQAEADKYRGLMREGLAIPTQQAQYQTKPYHMALGNWAATQHPTATKMITRPLDTFKEWWRQPINLGKRPPAGDRPAPWEQQKLPPLPKATW